jgi:hypothetical protein
MSYSYLDLASDVLKQSPSPLTYQEIWQTALEKGLANKLGTTGKTPWQTLGARLYVEVRDNDASHIIKVGGRPARFFLRSREAELPKDVAGKIEREEIKRAETKTDYKERDLHPLLTYFAFSNPAFNRGRSIYTKTIYNEKAAKSGYDQWTYPDMVGFCLPLGDWHPNVIALNTVCDNNSLRLYSFELKKSLSRKNYRESFFQAVSNSSWAHEGYLVAADILQDDEFLAELDRLSSSFGIGIIQLDPRDIDGSSVLYPARVKPYLDWETVNKLCEQSPDFAGFLKSVRDDFATTIHRSDYDEVIKDVDAYIAQKLKIKK